MIPQILAAVAPVIFTSGFGYCWVRSGRKFDQATLRALVSTVGTPFLVFSTLIKTQLPANAFATMGIAIIVALVGFTLVATCLVKLAGLKLRTYVPSLSFPNTGNLGLPLALYAFGHEGLSYAVIFYAIVSIANFTVGQAMAAGSANWKSAARSPIALAAVVGLFASYQHITLPVWLGNTLSLIAGMTIPLLLLMLGASLATIKVSRLPRAFVLSCVRIGMGVAVGTLVAMLFGLQGIARSAFILQCAMPVAVYNYLFAQMWNNEPEEVAGMVVVSTLLSIVSVPLLLAWLIR